MTAAFCASAVAGPPWFTDDPVPTDTRHWEIYAFFAGAGTGSTADGAAGFDLNYGPLPDVQLTATLPVNFARDNGTQIGAGDIEVGVKYRFYQAEKAGFAVAVFPRVFLPSAGHTFGSGKVGLLLPLWAQKDAGPWSVFGGGGFTVNPGTGNHNFWQGSVAVSRTVSGRLSLGAEVMHRGPDTAGGQSYTALNAGGTFRLGGPFAILFSGGPGLLHRHGGGSYNFYTALSANF
jgi:hypothetical protein